MASLHGRFAQRLEREIAALKAKTSQDDYGPATEVEPDDEKYVRGIEIDIRPKKAPLEDRVVRVRLYASAYYPNTPPKMELLKVPYHPNFFPNGNICLRIIEDWSPARNFEDVLLELLDKIDNLDPMNVMNMSAEALRNSDPAAYAAAAKDSLDKR